jgi:hypothetical protein
MAFQILLKLQTFSTTYGILVVKVIEFLILIFSLLDFSPDNFYQQTFCKLENIPPWRCVYSEIRNVKINQSNPPASFAEKVLILDKSSLVFPSSFLLSLLY